MEPELTAHWDEAYATKGEEGVSWFEENPEFSLKLIHALRLKPPRSLIDVGGDASRLVDAGLREGWTVAVLDISGNALETTHRAHRYQAGTAAHRASCRAS